MNLKGKQGEEIGCRYLEKKGYSILDRNFHSRYGELDIVCQRGGTIVFCEVKHYKSRSMVSPLTYINTHQKTKIRTTAEVYLEKNLEENLESGLDKRSSCSELEFRFDILLIEDGLVQRHLQGVDI